MPRDTVNFGYYVETYIEVYYYQRFHIIANKKRIAIVLFSHFLSSTANPEPFSVTPISPRDGLRALSSDLPVLELVSC